MLRQALIDARGSRTQTEVAEEMGFNQKYISKIELGVTTPSAKNMAIIANFYKQTIEELFPDIFLFNNTPKRR